jgi:hypothetical protein
MKYSVEFMIMYIFFPHKTNIISKSNMKYSVDLVHDNVCCVVIVKVGALFDFYVCI